jgi:hypothetical protein
MSSSDLTLFHGDEEQLTAIFNPDNASNKKVTWSSDDPDAVQVDDKGKITAVGIGNAKITVTTDEGPFTATCNVTVVPRPVEDLTISPTEIRYLGLGSMGITATVTPANATNTSVIWSSSNTSVVTVDAYGNLTAVAKGFATITAKLEGFVRTCEVEIVYTSRTIGDNLLVNPGFEKGPSSGDKPIPEWISIAHETDGSTKNETQEKWFIDNFGGAAVGAPAWSNTNFFTTGNGLPIAGILVDNAAARIPQCGGGIYQIVNLPNSLGGDYYISIKWAFRGMNAEQTGLNQKFVRIRSEDGTSAKYLDLELIPDVVAPNPTAATQMVSQPKVSTGIATIPAGVSKIRFQVDQLDPASPRAPIFAFDDLKFCPLSD